MIFGRWKTWAALAVGVAAAGTASLHATGMPPAGSVGTHAATVGTAGALTGSSREMTSIARRYALHLHHLHTDERIDIVYRIGDTYLPEALEKLNYFLRDYRTEDEITYDPTEFDLLHTLMADLHRPGGVIDIVCGYRTPETNEYLRTRAAVTGVAEHSQHMQGHAIDIQVPGVSTATLRNAALAIGAGGVGYYPVSHFVHVDVGPVREWQFGGFRRVRARGTHHHSVRRRRG